MREAGSRSAEWEIMAFCGIRKFIAAFRRLCYYILSRVWWIQSTKSYSVYWGSLLVLYPTYPLTFQMVCFSQISILKLCGHPLCLLWVLYSTVPGKISVTNKMYNSKLFSLKMLFSPFFFFCKCNFHLYYSFWPSVQHGVCMSRLRVRNI